jgi:hypothetical protein
MCQERLLGVKVEGRVLTCLQCCREAKAPSLVVRVLGDGVPEEKELVVLCRQSNISHRLCNGVIGASHSPCRLGGDVVFVNGTIGGSGWSRRLPRYLRRFGGVERPW